MQKQGKAGRQVFYSPQAGRPSTLRPSSFAERQEAERPRVLR
jgi:hypothetical protein